MTNRELARKCNALARAKAIAEIGPRPDVPILGDSSEEAFQAWVHANPVKWSEQVCARTLELCKEAFSAVRNRRDWDTLTSEQKHAAILQALR